MKDSDWISVKDRLPKPMEPVIICRIGFAHKGGVAVQAGYLLPDGSWNISGDYTVKGVLYWMPMPKPPKELLGGKNHA